MVSPHEINLLFSITSEPVAAGHPSVRFSFGFIIIISVYDMSDSMLLSGSGGPTLVSFLLKMPPPLFVELARLGNWLARDWLW